MLFCLYLQNYTCMHKSNHKEKYLKNQLTTLPYVDKNRFLIKTAKLNPREIHLNGANREI